MEVASTRAAESGLRDFRAVYRAHYGFVWHALHRFGVAPAVVDDAVQDVFVVAYRRRESYCGSSPKPWLYGIARRVASNYRRSSLRRHRRDQALPRPTRPAVHDGTREAIEGLERYLAGLRSEDRELFVLSELEGLTGPELASVTGRNVQTLYTRIRKLKVELGEHVGSLERVRRERPQATARSWALLLPALQGSPTTGTGIAAAASGWWAATGWGWAVGTVGAAALALVVSTRPATGDEPTRAAEAGRDRGSAGARAHASTSPAGPAGSRAAVPASQADAGDAARDSVPASGADAGGAAQASAPASEADAGDAARASVPSSLAPGAPEASRGPAPSPAAPSSATAAHRDASRDLATSPSATATHREPSSPSRRGATPDASTSDGLGVETELLRRASTELAAGHADAALRTCLEHGRRFPESALADLRTAVRIEALCELGRAAQARGEAETFLREHPGSPVAERIERTCTSAS